MSPVGLGSVFFTLQEGKADVWEWTWFTEKICVNPGSPLHLRGWFIAAGEQYQGDSIMHAALIGKWTFSLLTAAGAD